MFQINGFLKFAEEDNFKEGCDPDTSSSYSVDMRFTGHTAEEVIQKATKWLGVDLKDGIERNACDERGRVDFALMEGEDGTPITKAELAAWKKGKARAWYSVYTCFVEEVRPAKL